jgi:hypothetical protein
MNHSVLCANGDCEISHHSWLADGASRDGWSKAKGRWRCPRHAACQHCEAPVPTGTSACASCANEREP